MAVFLYVEFTLIVFEKPIPQATVLCFIFLVKADATTSYSRVEYRYLTMSLNFSFYDISLDRSTWLKLLNVHFGILIRFVIAMSHVRFPIIV